MISVSCPGQPPTCYPSPASVAGITKCDLSCPAQILYLKKEKERKEGKEGQAMTRTLNVAPQEESGVGKGKFLKVSGKAMAFPVVLELAKAAELVEADFDNVF